MTQALQDLLVPDIQTPGVPRGHGAITGYSPALVARIIDAAFEQAARDCESQDEVICEGGIEFTFSSADSDDCASSIRARKGSMKP